MTPDLMELMADVTIDLMDELKANDNLQDLRTALADVKNTFIDEFVNGNVSEAVAQRGNKIFGESSILLRFVVPHVATQDIGGDHDAKRTQLVLGQFVQFVANGNDAPKGFDEATKNAYLEQSARVKEKMGNLLSSLNIPTSNELKLEIATKVMGSLVEDLPSANNGGEPNIGNAPLKDDNVKGSPKPETNNLAKTNTSNEKDDIDENLGDLNDLDDEINDDFDNINLDHLDDEESEDEVDEETKRLQELADKKMLPEKDESDDLTDLLDNLRQTPMSEKDKKHLEDMENEFNEIMNSDK